MAGRTVQWIDTEWLDCGCNTPADVILLLKPEVITQDVADVTRYSISAQLLLPGQRCSALDANCNNPCSTTRIPRYLYTFSYDDAPLVAGRKQLVMTDILGVICRDYRTLYLDEQLALSGGGGFTIHGDEGTNQIVAPGDTLSFFGGSGIVTQITSPNDVNISFTYSAEANNQIVFSDDDHLPFVAPNFIIAAQTDPVPDDVDAGPGSVANGAEIYRLELSIVNPSAVRAVNGLVQWGWQLYISSTNFYGGGAQSRLQFDGIPAAIDGDAYISSDDASLDGSTLEVQRFQGGNGSAVLNIPAGGTVVVELIIYARVDVSRRPELLKIGHPYLSFLGGTTVA